MYPKISIVTSTYNQAAYIEETILSVINQSYKNFEYIIIDGGSSDETISIVSKYKNYLKLFISEPDLGCADALNKGLKFCDGDIFYYLNSDDYLLPNALSNFINFFNKNKGFDVYYGHGIMKNEISHKVKFIYSQKWVTTRYVNITSSIIQPSTFFNLNQLKRFKIEFNILNTTCWDYEILFDADRVGLKIKRLPFDFKFSVFRVHSNSITGSSSNNVKHNQKYENDKKMVFQKANKKINKANKILIYIYKLYYVFIDPLMQIKKIESHLFKCK